METQLINFIESFNIEKSLHESIMQGYYCIFESFNSWNPNVTPIMPPSSLVGQPMATYQNIMKQLPSQVTATGTGSVGGPNDNYKYEPSLAEPSRDIREETNNQWENAPKFRKYVSTPSKPIDKMIKNARRHTPNGAEQLYTQTGAGSMVSGIASANFNLDVPLIQGGSVGGSTSGGATA